MIILGGRKQLEAYRKYLNLFKDHYVKMVDASYIEKYALAEELFGMVKEAAPCFYNEVKFSAFYKRLLDTVIECESLLVGKGIAFDGSIYSFYDGSDLDSVDNALDYIATKVRNRLIDEYKEYLKKNYNTHSVNVTIDQLDLANLCETVSVEVSEECKEIGISCRVVRIDPGFDRNKELYYGSGYHYFNIITYKGMQYLMDLTYSQFFDNDTSNMFARLGTPLLTPCEPGIYMLSDEQRVKTADLLLRRGWIPFDEENIKNYFDGFALSVRNGLYYESNGKVDYYTEYTADDYLKFLGGYDSMFNHEPREFLGRQIKPLKDPHMEFCIK